MTGSARCTTLRGAGLCVTGFGAGVDSTAGGVGSGTAATGAGWGAGTTGSLTAGAGCEVGAAGAVATGSTGGVVALRVLGSHPISAATPVADRMITETAAAMTSGWVRFVFTLSMLVPLLAIDSRRIYLWGGLLSGEFVTDRFRGPSL